MLHPIKDLKIDSIQLDEHVATSEYLTKERKRIVGELPEDYKDGYERFVSKLRIKK